MLHRYSFGLSLPTYVPLSSKCPPWWKSALVATGQQFEKKTMQLVFVADAN
jgi:hypothetical protein